LSLKSNSYLFLIYLKSILKIIAIQLIIKIHQLVLESVQILIIIIIEIIIIIIVIIEIIITIDHLIQITTTTQTTTEIIYQLIISILTIDNQMPHILLTNNVSK
jgi:hypothetical protein